MDPGSAKTYETPLEAFGQAFVMILVSEIGDKTFLIAAIMATRHARITVFGGAFASLMVMSILSAAMGKVILGLIPAKYTQYVAALLFLVFGVRMLQEAMHIPPGFGHIQEEIKEVEDELEEDEGMMDPRGRKAQIDAEEGRSGLSDSSAIGNGSSKSISMSTLSNGIKKGPSITPGRHNQAYHPLSGSRSRSRDGRSALENARARFDAKRLKDSTRNFCSQLVSPVFAQAFILTFLGEWGDRSQIATIALGGANSVPVVAFGTISGHAVCTAGAVIGGRLLSTKISVRHITFIGAGAFLFFAAMYLYEGWTSA